MNTKLVAKLRSGFITDACGVPLRGSTEKVMNEAADLIEQQAKELAEAQARIELLEHDMKSGDFESLYANTVFELQEAQARVVVLETAAKDAPAILKHMIRTSEKACPPMHYLLTHDGLYGFHMANLLVRNDGKEYVMEADWADNCGKLVKHLTEALASTDTAAQTLRAKHYEECAVIAERTGGLSDSVAPAIRAAAKEKP